MFLVRPLTRRLPRLPTRIPTRAFTTPIEHDIRNLIANEKESQTDPAVLSELDGFLDASPSAVPESDTDKFDLDLTGFSEDRKAHASVLHPEPVARNSKELFGSQERTTLQTLPNGFDTRLLPLPGPLPETFSEIEYASTVVHGRSIHRPFRHPRTHGLPAAVIQFRSHDVLTMSLFVHFATHAAYSLGIPCSRMFSLPTQRQLWTVPRGPFIHKKSQENFERKVHRRGLKAWDADPAVIDLWFKYLRRHAMGGVGMRCVKWERVPFGIGRKMESEAKEKLDVTRPTKSRIKALGDQIVRQEMGSRADNIQTE
ncbi:ribosomal protein S10 domain-containing protein [Roridomyces roridus]|uniref:Ribosomal protein S10 domain-containing protein n=1 Tax=Roridomyces roridus TaxID=1738132 RepID=A0AAD7C7S3_9AGAR|nr:ribosomal protein S10 domain-containing protein [Roridomyces roridus]